MKQHVHEIKIKDLLGDVPKYKREWLSKGSGLGSAVRSSEVRRVKMDLFSKMELGIDQLKRSKLAEETIKIYKKKDAPKFDSKGSLKVSSIKKNPVVSSKKI